MAAGSLLWFRYAWNGFGGSVEDLEAHRKSNLMRFHYVFIGLVILVCTYIALLA